MKHRPLFGIAAVLAGAFIATLNTRVTTFGLADIRGGLGLGFDEGSWLTSMFAAGQMAVAPAAAWLSQVVGVRRLLLCSCMVFILSSLLLPWGGDYNAIMALQLLRGLSVGTFIPATLGFIMRNLPPGWLIWGLAAYSFRFVFSQNIGASIEAWYSENGMWQLIFWQNVLVTPVMLLLIWVGMPEQAIDRDLLRRTDWGAMLFPGFGFALLYVALDQGNRLDWLDSGVVVGLLAAGLVLVAAFLINEALVPTPLMPLRLLIEPHVWIPASLIVLYGFGVTATAFILPDYLVRIQNLRALQIGEVLNWIALPQLVLVPLVTLALRWIDSRLLMAVGYLLLAVGSALGTGLTHEWANDDFLQSQIVEALGLSLALTATIVYIVANLTPAQAAGIAVVIQTARLLGTEVGSAVIQTAVREREQIHSNLLGQHVMAGMDTTDVAITAFSNPFAASSGDAAGQGIRLIALVVQRESYVLAYIDAFWLVTAIVAASLLLIVMLKPPPRNWMTPPRLRSAPTLQ
jgi:DHA2 family multidrug resistance protein